MTLTLTLGSMKYSGSTRANKMSLEVNVHGGLVQLLFESIEDKIQSLYLIISPAYVDSDH